MLSVEMNIDFFVKGILLLVGVQEVFTPPKMQGLLCSALC